MPRPATLPEPAALEDHLGFWLRFVSNHVSSRFMLLLEAEGVTVTEWVAMRTLWSRAETTHAELITALGVTKGAASKVMSRLAEKGLAERGFVDGRAREQTLTLTPAGKKLVPRLAALADENEAHFFGHLSATERRALATAMQALVQYHQLNTLPTR